MPPDKSEFDAKLERLRRLEQEVERKREAQLELARNDFSAMLEFVIKDQRTNEKIKLDEIHKTWIEHIETCWERELHAAILAPFGSGKTEIVACGLPLFLIGRDNTLRLKIVSANDDLSRQRVGQLRKYIEMDDDYHELFPNVVPSQTQDWTKSKLFVERPTRARDATIEAKGIMSSGIGARCDGIIFDDVNDARNTLHQPRLRNMVWTNFTGVWLSRLEPGGRIALIACLTGDSKILLGSGLWKPLSAVKVGDTVWSVTQDGYLCRKLVQEVISQGYANTITVHTDRSSQRCTPDHPFLTVHKQEGWFWKPAGELKKGDVIATVKSVPTMGKPPHNPLDSKKRIDRKWLFLLGFMFGDGWVTKYVRGGKQKGVKSYCVCVAKGVKASMNRGILKLFAECMGVTPYETPFGYYRIDSAPIARALLKLGLVGKAKTKVLPAWLYELSPQDKRMFLRGLLCADGWKVKEYGWKRKGFRQYYGIKLTNKRLIEGIHQLALTCGVRPSNISMVTHNIQPPHSKQVISSTSWHVWLSFTYHLAEGRSLWVGNLGTDLRLERVRAVTHNTIQEEVFDLTVEEDTECFISNGFVVHNTRWHVRDLVGRIMEDEDMRKSWGFLIQRVSEDFTKILCEYFYGREAGGEIISKKEVVAKLINSGLLTQSKWNPTQR